MLGPEAKSPSKNICDEISNNVHKINTNEATPTLSLPTHLPP